MARDLSLSPPIGIIAYSDFYDLPERRVWGDYWLKENLAGEFVKLGYPVDHSRPGILLHLFGEPVRDLPSDTYNILWIHSHPDWITPGILGKYRKIYCISEHFTKKITGMGFDAETMMIPTNMTPLNMRKLYDIVFVGNTKRNLARKIIRDMGIIPYNIKIWGWGWRGLVPDEWFAGDYYENRKLNQLYAASKIILNDHHEDMRREGFLNPRVLDGLASGGFVISDNVPGMNELLDNSVITYETPAELRGLIEKYLNDDSGRASLTKKGARAALKYTYTASCLKIISHIKGIV
ncbi:MAG: glycosyltransferase [Nitrospirota bacterium]|nr:glycosyltransferase [Nitrospirota bacterium]